MDNYMKKLILSFVLSIFTGYITANNFVQQIQQYGDNGDFHRMDSIYSLAKQQVNYQNDPVAAVEIHTTYATYLNSKREYDKAYSILKDVKKEISLLKDRRFSSDTQKKLLQSESIATYEIAYGLWSNNKLDEAKKFAHEAIKLFEQANDTSRLAESYNLSGVIYKNSFMLDKAILMYKKALKITEQQKDYTLSAIISSNIATLYNELEETQKAIVFSRRFFSYPQTDTLAFDYQINKISYLCNHAILLTNGKYYKNAIDSLQLATRLLQDNMPAGLKLYIYTNYAKALYDTGETKSAIKYYQKAISYKKQSSNEYNKANLDYLYGYMLFQATDSLAQARQYLSNALDFYRKNPSVLLTKSLLALAEVEAKRNNVKESYKLALEAYETEQKIQHKNFHNRLAGFEAELKTKEKDLEIISLNAEKAKNKIAYQTRIYISKELHNNVCNELLAAEMQLQQANASQLAAQLGVIRETVRNISHQLSTPNFSNISLYQMLNLYVEKLSALKSPALHPYIADEINDLSIPSENILEIYRILQEIISNIIKHAHAQNMYLTVSCTPSDIEVIVEDDGQGFDTSSSHNILTAGLGLQTIKERCNKLQGECEIESTLNKGTIIHMRFPV